MHLQCLQPRAGTMREHKNKTLTVGEIRLVLSQTMQNNTDEGVDCVAPILNFKGTQRKGEKSSEVS